MDVESPVHGAKVAVLDLHSDVARDFCKAIADQSGSAVRNFC